MQADSATIIANLANVRERIARAAERAERSPDSVRLVAVTKTVGIDEAQTLYELGVTEFGENRIDVAKQKIDAVDLPVRWHMIGNVQRRKARDAVALFDSVDSIDRIELAHALDKRSGEVRDNPLVVLLEVNASGEETKHGFDPEQLGDAFDEIKQLEHLRVEGLMTMAPFVDDPELARPVFARLRGLAEELGLAELSMGMTNDFEVAIEEGATQIRVGSALFA